MSNPDYMQEVNLLEDKSEKLRRERAYARYLETKNFLRSLYEKRVLKRKRIISATCSAGVIGIYAYTVWRMQQETFLDDFEEPPRAQTVKKIMSHRYLRSQLSRLPPMPTIANLLRLYNLKALKQLSQVFLLEPRLIEKFVKAAGPIHNGLVCEVGPGPGGITRAIINRNPKSLLLIEKDRRFEPMLQSLEEAASSICPVEIKYADVLDFDLSKHFDPAFKKDWNDEPPNIHILGNLPFDVSTILIVRWLKDIYRRQNAWSLGRVRMTLTFQEEVAQRLVAPFLSQYRSRISIMAQNYCDVKYVFGMKGKSFLPPPKVDVGVVTATPLVTPIIPYPFEVIEKVVRTIFSTRQKHVYNGAKNLFPVAQRPELTNELLTKAEIPHTARPFQLSIEEYGRIIGEYLEICKRIPGLHRYDYRGPKSLRETEWQNNDCESEDNEYYSNNYNYDDDDDEDYYHESDEEDEFVGRNDK